MKFINERINNIPVTLIKTKKFKSVYISLYFKSKVTKENMTYRSVLKNILIEASKKYNTREKLYTKLLECYDATLTSTSERCGNYIINSFRTSALLDKYTKEGNINNLVDVFCDVVFNPLIYNEKFDNDIFNMVISKRKSELKRALEESNTLSEYLTYKNLNQNKAYTYLSELEILDTLTEEKLYQEYKNMINGSEVSLIVCGDITDQDFIKKITSYIKSNKKYELPLIINNDDEKSDFKEVVDKGYGYQNIIDIVLPIKNTNHYELNYVAPIYRVILGGMEKARLFTKIREENSLSYYVYARLEKDDSLINVIMAIEKENYKKALDLTLKIIDSMKNITEEELNYAKEEIKSSLLESQDIMSNVVGRCFNRELYDLPDTNEFIDKIKSVSKKEVEDFASKMKPLLCHFLEGESTNE